MKKQRKNCYKRKKVAKKQCILSPKCNLCATCPKTQSFFFIYIQKGQKSIEFTVEKCYNDVYM